MRDDPTGAKRLQLFTKKLPNGCIVWTGHPDKNGYGKLIVKGRRVGTHVLAYELAVGPVPPGLELDHLCRNTSCCNYLHLEPVTHAENMRRKLLKPHCGKGHLFDERNTMVVNGKRRCRTCHNDTTRKNLRATRCR